MELIQLELRGEPRERGREHGHVLRREIRALYEGWLACASRQRPRLDEAGLLAFTDTHIAAATRWGPHWVEEIKGIGETSTLGFERAFALNCWDELCSWMAVRSKTAPGGGCTAFAVTDGPEVLIGQNQDAWGWWRPLVVLNERDDDEAIPATICASHPGVLGTLGVNSSSIGLVANSLIPADRASCVPFAIVMREALRQTSLRSAIETVVNAPRSTGANYVLADASEAVDIETTSNDANVAYVNDAMAHSNHYLCDQLRGQELGGPMLPDTYLRERRMRRLLDQHRPSRSVTTMLTCLSDHEQAPTSICRHPAGEPEEMETLSASIIVPSESALHLTNGLPCSTQPVRFALT